MCFASVISVISNMASRAGSPNQLLSKSVRKQLLRNLRERADEGDPLAITGALVVDYLYRANRPGLTVEEAARQHV